VQKLEASSPSDTLLLVRNDDDLSDETRAPVWKDVVLSVSFGLSVFFSSSRFLRGSLTGFSLEGSGCPV